MHIRQFRPGDEPFLTQICLKTADAGKDGTGILPDDDLWAHIFALPYAEKHPDLAFVVVNDKDRPVGYILGTDDTDAFENWFATVYWPRLKERFPQPAESDDSREAGLLKYAYGRRPGAEPYSTEHPAHLHIDLLPEAQGAGWGRQLIDTFTDVLRERDIRSLHLGVDANNTGAIAFYKRLGFVPIPTHPGNVTLALAL